MPSEAPKVPTWSSINFSKEAEISHRLRRLPSAPCGYFRYSRASQTVQGIPAWVADLNLDVFFSLLKPVKRLMIKMLECLRSLEVPCVPAN